LNQPGLAEALGRQGRDYVEREYSWEAIDAKMERLFSETGGAAPHPPYPPLAPREWTPSATEAKRNGFGSDEGAS
jgi:hypothetical protein